MVSAPRSACTTMDRALTFVALPAEGRVFSDERTVRLADAGPDRRARLDALARYLHDVAEDDASEAGLSASIGWVLRKTRMLIGQFPLLGDTLRVDTFCSAVGRRWAERTTIFTAQRGPVAQAVSVWVAIDRSTGAAARLDGRFHEVYAPSAAGRRVLARLVLPPPPDGARHRARPWTLRRSDFDVWAHVNNAVSWAAVEDAVDPARWLPLLADLEHVRAIEPGAGVVMATEVNADGADVWLIDADSQSRGSGAVFSAARLGPARLTTSEGP